MLLLAGVAFVGCNKSETYADQLERQTEAINAYIVRSGINVISEEQFAAQGNTTDVSQNQYVLFSSSGVYMQIVEKGTGEPIKRGETATVLCRFSERNLMTDSLQLSNQFLVYSSLVDKIFVTNTSGTFRASFDPSSSLMYNVYRSTSVPSGWLVPMPYIGLGRLNSSDARLAHVRLIVPSQQGQLNATQAVYPTLYDITMQRGL